LFRFTKQTEYAILALQYITKNKNRLVSAKEIADELEIPFQFTSKILQQLIKSNIIESKQGVKGGYKLLKEPKDILITGIMEIFDPSSLQVNCINPINHTVCKRSGRCNLQKTVFKIKDEIEKILKNYSIENSINE